MVQVFLSNYETCSLNSQHLLKIYLSKTQESNTKLQNITPQSRYSCNKFNLILLVLDKL